MGTIFLRSELFEKLVRNRKYLISVLMIIIAILSLIPSSAIPKQQNLWQADKLVHILMYFCFTSFVFLLFSRSLSNKQVIRLGVLVIGFGVLMEILQGLLPLGRNFSFYDILANSLGCLMGYLIYSMLIRSQVITRKP